MFNPLKQFFHWIAHLLGMNEGQVVTWRDGEYVCIGFLCNCNKIDEKSITRWKQNFYNDEEEDSTNYKEIDDE